MFECFHCGNRSVIWQCDYDFSDFMLEGNGIVHTLHCATCGAEIEYYVPLDANYDKDEDAEN